MPFKSKAQRRKFAQLLVEGKISNETFEEWNRETGGKKLPERVVHRTRKKKAVKKAAAREHEARLGARREHRRGAHVGGVVVDVALRPAGQRRDRDVRLHA